VCYIQETLPSARWGFVPGAENPADLARGLTPIQLSEHTTWWTGPPWLIRPPEAWPPKTLSINESLEERPAKAFTTRPTPLPLWDLVYKYSTLIKLLRVTAIYQRVLARLRKRSQSSLTYPLTTQEIDNSKLFWVKHIQNSAFNQEIKILSAGKLLSKSHSLVKLTPFLDATGLLRIGGRHQASLLPPNIQHPLILPKESPLTSLIISDSHLRTLHGKTQLTLNYIRNDYWIIGGQAPVRSFIFKCVRYT